jgi:eukaryotic-like serine/threonine-protein kinase
MNMKIKPITIALLLCATLCFADDWVCFRGNPQRTGYSAERTGNPSAKPLWRFGPAGAFISSPSVVNGVLYIGSRDSTIYAIDAKTGILIWKKKVFGWVDSSPLLFGDSLVVGCRDEEIYVLDKNNGETIGEIPAGLQLSSPVELDDGSILSLIGHPLNSFSKINLRGIGNSWSLVFTQPMFSSPAVMGAMTAFGGNDGMLYGVDLTARSITWSLKTEGTAYLSTPAISESLVFFAPGDFDRNIYAVWLADGTLFWKSAGNAALAKSRARTAAQIPPQILYNLKRMSPLQRSKWLEYYQRQGAPFAGIINLSKNSTAVGTPDFVPSDNDIRTSSVAVEQDKVFVVQRELGFTNDIDMAPISRYTLLALDKATGNEVWRFTDYRNAIVLGYNSSPVIAGGLVFFGWGEGMLFAANKTDGEIVWRDTLAGDIISSPAISDKKLFIATVNGNLYAFNLTETAPGLTFQTSTYCYPNPARGDVSNIQVFVAENATLDMTLYNSSEKPVLKVSQAIPANEKYVYPWNISKAANGVYFAMIKVKYDSGKTDKKILKIAVLH